MCSVDCSPCQHATRKPVKTVKHRPDITVQPRVAVLMKRTVPRCLNGLIRDIVPRGGEVECVQAMHYLPNETVSVSPALGQQPPLLCSLTSCHWRPYFVAFGSKKLKGSKFTLPMSVCPRVTPEPLKGFS